MGRGVCELGLLAADKALEHLEEQVDDRDADEGEADRSDVRQDDRGIGGGGAFQIGDGGGDRSGHGVSAFGEDRHRREERREGEHLLIHGLCFFCLGLPLVVCLHRNEPPGRLDHCGTDEARQDPDAEATEILHKRGRSKNRVFHGRENVKKSRTGLITDQRREATPKRDLPDHLQRDHPKRRERTRTHCGEIHPFELASTNPRSWRDNEALVKLH